MMMPLVLNMTNTNVREWCYFRMDDGDDDKPSVDHDDDNVDSGKILTISMTKVLIMMMMAAVEDVNNDNDSVDFNDDADINDNDQYVSGADNKENNHSGV